MITMTRRLTVLDRLAGVALGLLLLASGLLVVDWHEQRFLDLPRAIDTSRVDDVLGSSWWPWAFAVAAVVLGLIGLRWLVAHTGRAGVSSTRLAASNETGRLVVDLGSVASAAADRLEQTAPVTDIRGRTHTVRGHTYVELRGRVAQWADVDDLVRATGTCVDEVTTAFDDVPVTCRVLLQAPRARRADRTDRVRVTT